MGLLAQIYRTASENAAGYDHSNGGLSSEVEKVTVVNMEGPFKPSDEAPAVIVEYGAMGSVRALPFRRKTHFEPGTFVGPMHGGTFIWTSDSRFRLTGQRLDPVALHDRFELVKQIGVHP